MRLPLFLLLLCASPLVAGCDSDGSSRAPGSSAPPPPADTVSVIANVDLDRLFAAPTPSEQAAVRTAWTQEDAQAGTRYRYEELARGEEAGATLVAFAGRLLESSGAPVVHHALVRIPARSAGDQRPLPVLFVSPLQGEVSPADFFLPGGEPDFQEDVIQIVVGHEGGGLRALGSTWLPTLYSGPQKTDADVATAAERLFPTAPGLPPTADFSRTAWAGLGQGGTTALLAAARSGEAAAVATWAAPTDYFLPSVEVEVRRLLRGATETPLPGLLSLFSTAILPIRDDPGDASRPDQARIEMLARSPRYFADALPPVFLVHSRQDDVVPFTHTDVLSREVPRPEPFGLSVYTFPDLEIAPTHSSTFGDPSGQRAAAAFLRYHLGL